MHLKAHFFGIGISVLMMSATPVSAKDPSPQQLLDMAVSCAYVVGIAEGNKVKMRYGAADWLDVVSRVEQMTGLDSDKSLNLAIAKYNRRARTMGADATLKYIKSSAQSCDREMAVIRS